MFSHGLRTPLAVYCALSSLLMVVSRAESLAYVSLAGQSSIDARPGRLSLQVHDTIGRPLSARARIAPATWAERLRFDRRGDLFVHVPASGLDLALAAGTYRLYVTRGPEWSIAERTIDVAAGRQLSHQITLAHEVTLPGWHAAELHVHSEHSADAAAHGGVEAAELIAEGIALAVATDHNRIGELAGLPSLAGAEITTWAPEIGHFNAFPLRELPRWRGTSPDRLIRALTRDPQVFVQVNHPRLDDHIAYFELGGFDGAGFAEPGFHLGVHGLEVWNGYDLARPARVHALLAEWRGWLAREHRLTATGGSDSHGAPGHLPGYPRTYTPAAQPDELAAQLRAGRAFVTNGPLLELEVDGGSIGGAVMVVPGRSLAIRLRVLAASWLRLDTLELWADEQRVWSIRLPPPASGSALDFVRRLELPAGSAKNVHALVRGGSGLERLLGRSGVEPLAFTNAVRLISAAARSAPAARARARRDPARGAATPPATGPIPAPPRG